MGTKKTDNHYTMDKVMLRLNNLPDVESIRVLDCFGGKGVIWSYVQKLTNKKILRDAIDERSDIEYFHMHGDNKKIMPSLDLSKYDVIDLDAYGYPVDQLEIVFRQKFKGVVFVTAIQTMHGGIPKKMASDLGFNKRIFEKAPSLLAKRGWQLLKQWLALNNVKSIKHRSKNRKHYFCFTINDAA